MAYRHKIVQGLADLIEAYGGKGLDPVMSAIWIGVRGQISHVLNTLDSNDAAVEQIRRKLLEVLEIEKEPQRDVERTMDMSVAPPPELVESTIGGVEPASEVEIAIEPIEPEIEDSGDYGDKVG